MEKTTFIKRVIIYIKVVFFKVIWNLYFPMLKVNAFGTRPNFILLFQCKYELYGSSHLNMVKTTLEFK